MFQIAPRSPVYDVVIIGSGAGGGTVTKVLADLGVNVALHRGRAADRSAKDFKEHMWPYQVPHRGIGDGGAGYFGPTPWAFGYFTTTSGGWQFPGEPYTVAPGSKFEWFRSRVVGGRTNHFGRISLRFADYDFTPYSRDGLGTDWPITYDELAPYYDKAESFIGVTGSKEGIRSAPDGMFQQCPPPRVHEMLVQRAAKKLNIPCIPSRLAVITQADQRAPGLPLLRPVRPRLRHGVELFLEPGAGLPRHEDRASEALYRRYGARADRRCVGQSHRRFLHRQSHSNREGRSAAARWFWPAARANPRACCSIRNPLRIRTASPMDPAMWDGI